MTSDFMLVHREGSHRFSNLENVTCFSFATCLRHIVVVEPESFSTFEDVDASDAIMRGEEAYSFLLEVICGLRSPLIGETEVYGQFKTAVANYTTPATPWGGFLARTFKNLFEDAKKIRQEHLEDLGSQSYGSVLRREIKGLNRIHVVGAGQLTKEMLPWITKDGNSVVVHCRDVAKATELLGDGSNEFVSISEMTAKKDLDFADVIVIAAPIESGVLETWIPRTARPSLVVDLRADSSSDRLARFQRVLNLGQMLARLNDNQELLKERKRAALEAIESAVANRARHVEYRPFGWDDVCA